MSMLIVKENTKKPKTPFMRLAGKEWLIRKSSFIVFCTGGCNDTWNIQEAYFHNKT